MASANAKKHRLMVAYVATDGGIDALRLAIALARTTDAAIDIVMATTNAEVTPGLYPRDRGFSSIVEQQLEGWLADARAEVPGEVEATTRIAVGDSLAGTLLDQAKELGSSLIIAGSRGGGLFKRMTLGSVVNTLLHSCPIPLAIAPKGYNNPGPIQQLTALYGPRPGASDVVKLGKEASAKLGIPLRLVSLDIDKERPINPELLHDEADVVMGATPAEAVSNLQWSDSELVFVGSARLAPEGHLFLGSTAAQILRHIPVPAIVIPRGYTQPT